MRFIDRLSPSQRANISRRWRQVDSALVTAAHLAEPLSLALLSITGLVLPWLEGDLAPIPAFRAWHGLAGLALVLILVWRGMGRIVSFGFLLSTPDGRSDVAWILRHSRWRYTSDAWVGAPYRVLLALVVYSGVERFWGERFGISLVPLLSPIAWASLHTMISPYFWALLLLLSYLRGRKLARALLAEIRSP